MKAAVLLVATTLCLGLGTDARRLASDSSSMGQVSACRGGKDVLLALHDKQDDLHKLLDVCTRPLLYLGYKHQTPEQAKAYCNSTNCRKLMVRLNKFSPCAWEDIPEDSENELLSAQRVFQDCS